MIDSFLNELRNNPRLRWGVALIIGIIWLYGILLLREALQEQEQQHRATAQTISRLRAQLAQPEWIARVAPARELAMQLEGRLWQAPTPGLAQAAFQDWLNAAVIKAGATHSQITVIVLDEAGANVSNQNQNPDATTPSDLWKIKAKLSFDFTSATLLDFMGRIENHERQVIVGALNVRKEPAPRVEMELIGYFQKQAVSAARPNKELVPL